MFYYVNTVFNVLNQMSPLLIGFHSAGSIQGIGCGRGVAALARGRAGVELVDTRQPATLRSKTLLAFPALGDATAVDVLGDLVVAGFSSGNLVFIDANVGVSLPAVLVPGARAISGLCIRGSRVFAVLYRTLAVVSLTSYTVTHTLSLSHTALNLFCGVDKAIVTHSRGFDVVSFAAAVPALLGQGTTSQRFRNTIMASANVILAAAGPTLSGSRVQMYNLTDPRLVNTYE